jgi:hypothetical protein
MHGGGSLADWLLDHGMRGFSPAAVFVVFGLQGCIPLPQMEQLPSRVPFHAVYDLGDDYVLFTIGGSENRPKDYVIIPQHSYVIDPAGGRHPIRVRPHHYDLSENFPFIRDEVSVLRSEVDPKPIGLHDGTWKFVLACRRSGVDRTDEFSFRIWTFYYNPIIHGPPN